MRIAILTDSLGIPRPWMDGSDKTEFEDVYGYVLRRRLGPNVEVDLFTMGGIDTADAVQWIETLVSIRRPDAVIFQLGINDCSPRIFKKGSRSIILRPWFSKLTYNIIMRIINRLRYKITLITKKVYIKKDEFRKNINIMFKNIQKYNKNVKFYCISICNAPDWLAYRSANLNKNIDEYNIILNEVFGPRFIDVNKIGSSDQIHISDGVHLTKESRRALADRLFHALATDFPMIENEALRSET